MRTHDRALARCAARYGPASDSHSACCSGLAGHADPAPPGGVAGTLIRRFHMAPIPQEGAWFGVTYTSNDRIDGAGLPARYGGQSRRVSSAIVALETPRDFSALHRLQSDEVWHFYSGTPLKMLLLYPDGHGETVTLGANVGAGQLPQVTVPRGVWQGSMPRSDAAGTYAFFGTQVSPGFESADFEIGYRDELQRAYPAFAALIGRLTRTEFAHRQGGIAASGGDAPQWRRNRRRRCSGGQRVRRCGTEGARRPGGPQCAERQRQRCRVYLGARPWHGCKLQPSGRGGLPGHRGERPCAARRPAAAGDAGLQRLHSRAGDPRYRGRYGRSAVIRRDLRSGFHARGLRPGEVKCSQVRSRATELNRTALRTSESKWQTTGSIADARIFR